MELWKYLHTGSGDELPSYFFGRVDCDSVIYYQSIYKTNFRPTFTLKNVQFRIPFGRRANLASFCRKC